MIDQKEISRKEYVSRINRVMDYISLHMDQPIDLNVLAQVAMFSPYHFHRIFTFIVGETPNNFLFRLRIEKSAQLLNDSSNIPVGDIACRCGFNSASAFSRSFRKYFGMTTKEFRSLEKQIYIKDGIRYSKNGKTLRKIDQNGKEIVAELCPVELQKLIIMGTKVEIKEMPEVNVIYCRHIGAFDQIGKAYEKLYKWAGMRGLLTAETKGITLYHDDPSITSIDKVRQDACITYSGECKVEGEIGKETIPGGKYAVGRFEIPVGQDFEKAWNTMCTWVMESGFEPSGSPYELYHNDHTQHPEQKFIVDICIPVKPM